jgi:UDP-N-acetyl-D-galactosamine dehydrogenase
VSEARSTEAAVINPLLADWNGRTIAVIGLGYVGLPLAVEFGKKRKVIGFDINKARIEELQSGQDHTLECSPEELKGASFLRYTHLEEDLNEAQVYIVTVPTPIDAFKRPDLGPLMRASETVGKLLKRGDCVIYESTVYPGCTEEDCVPVLEKHSGLKFNEDFACGYSPERINPGDKEHRLPSIVKVTSGSTPEVAEVIDLLYREIVVAGTHKASSIKVAEAAKVIENTQRDLNIALMNELSLIFNRLNIDTLEVLKAAGTKWNFLPFRPGLVGGHCIGVDPYYLTHKAQSLGYRPEVTLAGRRINDNMGSYVARTVIRLMVKNDIDVTKAVVGVLGVTFKENCPDIRNSKVFDIIAELKQWGLGIKVSDPWADAREVKAEYGVELKAINHHAPVDALIVAVAHQAFVDLSPIALRQLCASDGPTVIADLKSIYDVDALEKLECEVFRL